MLGLGLRVQGGGFFKDCHVYIGKYCAPHVGAVAGCWPDFGSFSSNCLSPRKSLLPVMAW